MSSKRERNSRFVVDKGTIKEIEIRSRRSKICLFFRVIEQIIPYILGYPLKMDVI